MIKRKLKTVTLRCAILLKSTNYEILFKGLRMQGIKKKSTWLKLLLLSMISLTSHAESQVESDAINITTKNVWIREAPPTATVLAAYMTLQNPTDKDITLICAQSPAFSDIMFHKTEVVNDVAKMRHADEIVIPANGSFELAPGGFHMMLMGKKSPLKAGDNVEITLIFKEINNKKVTAAVKKIVVD